MSWYRYGTAHRVDRQRWRERMPLQEAIQTIPRHPTATPTTARQPALPEPCGCATESDQRHRVAGDPVVRKVTYKLLTQGPMLVLNRPVPVSPTPLRQGL